MEEYMKKRDFERECEAQGLKKQADGSWAKSGYYKERVDYNTNTGNVSNGGGGGNRAYVSTIQDSIKKATGK
jgi:hypothetical protein